MNISPKPIFTNQYSKPKHKNYNSHKSSKTKTKKGSIFQQNYQKMKEKTPFKAYTVRILQTLLLI